MLTVGGVPLSVEQAPNIAAFLEEAGLATTQASSLYLHIPFCFHRCHYCDFYSVVDTHRQHGDFVDRLLEELAFSAERLSLPLKTMFVGGGTPTLLEPSLWQRLGAAFKPLIDGETECTVEANPETVEEPLLDVLVDSGVNRLSIGAQSFDEGLLKALERHHAPANVGRAVRLARQAGIKRVSLDLIFAIPGQTMQMLEADLDQALDLEPEHLSYYALTYEPKTPLFQRRAGGLVEQVDEDLEAAMFERVQARLAEAGYAQYEISNYARGDLEVCRHNLVYWQGQNYWPLGPGAAGKLGALRWRNAPALPAYLKSQQWPAVVDVERLDEAGQIGEQLMLGLRLNAGLSGQQLEALLANDPASTTRRAAIEGFCQRGLLEQDGMGLRLTQQGRMLGDGIMAALL